MSVKIELYNDGYSHTWVVGGIYKKHNIINAAKQIAHDI